MAHQIKYSEQQQKQQQPNIIISLLSLSYITSQQNSSFPASIMSLKLLHRVPQTGHHLQLVKHFHHITGDQTVTKSSRTRPLCYPSVIGTTNGQHRNFSFASFFTTVSNSAPVHHFQEHLVLLHDLTGLPWWATIVVSTVALRTVITLPLAIYSNKVSAKLENITGEMPAIVQELKMEAAMARKKFQWSEQQTRIVYNRSVRMGTV